MNWPQLVLGALALLSLAVYIYALTLEQEDDGSSANAKKVKRLQLVAILGFLTMALLAGAVKA